MNDDKREAIVRTRLHQVADLVDHSSPPRPPAVWDRQPQAVRISRVRVSRQKLPRVSIALALVAIVAVCSALVASWQIGTRGPVGSTGSTSPALATTAPGTDTISAAPTSGQWPFTFPSGTSALRAVFASDGSFYAATDELVAVDVSGRMRPGWPVPIPVGRFALSIAIAPDGSLLVVGPDQIADLDLSGKVRVGWPVDLPDGFMSMTVGPDGTIVVVQAPVAGHGRVLGLRVERSNPVAWSTQVDGGASSVVVAADGVAFLGLPVREADAPDRINIVAIGPSGERLAGWPSGPWDGMATAPSGDLAVWAYETRLSGNLYEVGKTHLALLDQSGKARPGWPRVIDGPASAPAFVSDGALYLTLGGADHGSSPASVMAIDPDGATKSGWPVLLPRGFSGVAASIQPLTADVAQPPLVGPGTVYVAAQSTDRCLVQAFDEAGKVAAGWPYILSAGGEFIGSYDAVPGGPQQGPRLSPVGSLYVAWHTSAGDNLVALASDGKPVGGWPYEPPGLRLALWVPISDGGLGVVGDFTQAPMAIRLGVDGVPAR
jgi:hypothetical protein